ncbi:MAG: hypothetical protein JWQ21_2948 [Herminiimonas sp.]|nr:hypothetical protein [Herminiimonas sp.]
MENALYFPNINLPDSNWTFRTLLYWDSLISIVPEAVASDDATLSPMMVNMIQSGLVAPVEYGLLSTTANAISTPFLDYLNVLPRRPKDLIWKEKFAARVHFQKISPALRHALETFDVGHPGEEGWWHLRPSIARAYMSLLALTMSANDEVRASAVTDSVAHLVRVDNVRRDSRNPNAAKSVMTEIRNEFLQELFPVPVKASKDLDTLVRFKESHGASLRLFRVEVEREVALLATIADASQRNEAIRAAKMRFNEQTSQAQNAMRLSFGEIVFNMIIPAATNIAAYQLNSDLATAITGGGTILQAAYSAQKIWNRRGQTVKLPMGYAAFANRRFSVSGKYKFPCI